ncbi:unnamed protein product, partial [Brassica oleracea]
MDCTLGDDGEDHSTNNEALSTVSYRIEWNLRHTLKLGCTGTPTWCRLTYRSCYFKLHQITWDDHASLLEKTVTYEVSTFHYNNLHNNILSPTATLALHVNKLFLILCTFPFPFPFPFNAFGQGRDNNLGDDMPGATCVSCICSKSHKLSATDQATGSCGVHLLKQQELRNTRSGAQQRSHM